MNPALNITLKKLAYLLAREYPSKGRILPPGNSDPADAADEEKREKQKIKLDTEKITDKLRTTVSGKKDMMPIAKKRALAKHRLFWLSDRGQVGEKGLEKDFDPFPTNKETSAPKG